MFERRAYKIIFMTVGLLATSSVIFVYARYWSRGESPPISLAASLGVIFLSAVNAITRTRNRRHLLLKGIVAALTIAAAFYVIRIGVR